jgi:hypothetical protein
LASRYGITFAQLALVHPTGSISVTDISLVAAQEGLLKHKLLVFAERFIQYSLCINSG